MLVMFLRMDVLKDDAIVKGKIGDTSCIFLKQMY